MVLVTPSVRKLQNMLPFIFPTRTVRNHYKNEDRVVDNNEGLPQALLGSCNDRARQIYIKMPIKDPSINPPTTSLFWKVRMLRGGEVRSRDLISPMLDKKRFRSPLPHLTRSDGLNSFNECQHPDETQRMQLSRELGLAPRQIKFWFQNRRKLNKGDLVRRLPGSPDDFLEDFQEVQTRLTGSLPGTHLEDFLEFWKKVRPLYNRRLPNEEKSDIKTYQNAQICYERETSSEDFQEVQTTSWKSSSALYFRRLTSKSSQKSSRSEKPAYPNQDLKNMHIQKRSNGLKTEKMMEDENHVMKNLQKQDKLVRKT
ncbi:hypothetical protein YC2023_010504 [Brassica napus]